MVRPSDPPPRAKRIKYAYYRDGPYRTRSQAIDFDLPTIRVIPETNAVNAETSSHRDDSLELASTLLEEPPSSRLRVFREKVSMELDGPVSLELDDPVSMELGEQVMLELGDQVSTELGKQISLELGEQVSTELSKQISLEFGERVSANMVSKVSKHTKMQPPAIVIEPTENSEVNKEETSHGNTILTNRYAPAMIACKKCGSVLDLRLESWNHATISTKTAHKDPKEPDASIPENNNPFYPVINVFSVEDLVESYTKDRTQTEIAKPSIVKYKSGRFDVSFVESPMKIAARKRVIESNSQGPPKSKCGKFTCSAIETRSDGDLTSKNFARGQEMKTFGEQRKGARPLSKSGKPPDTHQFLRPITQKSPKMPVPRNQIKNDTIRDGEGASNKSSILSTMISYVDPRSWIAK